MDKIRLNCRDNEMYPYSITIMGQERVLLKEKELFELYDQITDIIIDKDEYWENI